MDINAVSSAGQAGNVSRLPRNETAPGAELSRPPVALAAEQVQPAAPQAQSREPLEEAVSSIKEFAQSIQRNLNFALDDSSGQVVVKVTDGISGEVIRQIPSEDALRLAESLEEARGLLFKAEA
jgi:flagellar protein FlaG